MAAGFTTFFETFPDSILARSKYWLPFLKNHVKANSQDVLVGWSSGAVAAMRYAESNLLKGSVLVGPSYSDLGDELEKQSGYFDNPWKWEDILKHQGKIALFFGDDDPYIPQDQFEFIASKISPALFKIYGGKHFLDNIKFPELLDYIKKNYLQ